MDRIVEVELGQNLALDSALIAPNGTIAAYGSAKDMSPTLPFGPLLFKAVTLDILLIYILPEERRARAIATLTDLPTRGALDCRIGTILDLAEGTEAHDLVAQGGRAGATLLRP